MFYYLNHGLNQIFKTAKQQKKWDGKYYPNGKKVYKIMIGEEIKNPTEEQKQKAIDFDEYCNSLYERGLVPSPEQVNKWRWEYEQSNVKK